MAVHGIALLEQAKKFSCLLDAVADCHRVVASCGRSDHGDIPLQSPEQALPWLINSIGQEPVALVFGREDAGLNNEELQLCHFHVQIPTDEVYSSLNLGAAVMVICYELHKAGLRDIGTVNPEEDELWDQEKATGEQVEHFYEHLQRVLVAIDFHDPDNPRQLMLRMRRLFSRIRIDVMEMNILRGILTNIEYHIKDTGQDSDKRRADE